MSKTISAENLGPIANLEFALNSPGVTVLVAPNGSGKTILLEAVQAAARGEGKLPLRDRTRKGKVEAFGAIITIGGTCRHTGGFEVSNLEGRFDLAGLVDPRIKTPSAADRSRIKALVSLTGVTASPTMFRNHEAFEDFDTVVTSASLETDDPVEMASKIKDEYDRAALLKERQADREAGQATALLPPQDLDLDAEADAETLRLAYNEARDEVTKLAEQARNATVSRARIEESQALLKQLGDEELLQDRQALQEEMKDSGNSIVVKTKHINDLRLTITQLETEISACRNTITTGEGKLATIARQIALVEAAKQVVSSTAATMPDASAIEDADADMALAQNAVELGVTIREARANEARAIAHRRTAKENREKADKYRDAGKATDEVLSSCIKCPQLRVESDGKSARLVTDHSIRGASIAYHDLSDGEKWTLAIDIGADQVGVGGLLVISQVGWEGIDGANRAAIHQHAVNRGVYILTAEAASDPDATRDIIPTPMPHVEPTMEAPKPPAVKQTAPAKPVEKPKAAPKPKPVVPEFSEDEDIPF